MVRVLIYIVVLAALAIGLAEVADLPGMVSLKWPWWPLYGRTLEVAPLVAAMAALAAFIAFYLVVALLRFVLRIPALMSFTARARRQNKGVAAVSRGMIAAGAGDVRTADRAAREAMKLLGPTPLALLLQAQAAQLSGNRRQAEDAFNQMKDNPATRIIGLRGLYLEARRNGDEEAAHAHALEAHTLAALPWAGQAILERHAMADDWRGALKVVETNIARKLIDKDTGARQRAVLKTAIALEIAEREPEEALLLAREAIKLAPDLIPAYALGGRLLARKGDIRRGARMLETGWKVAPHPDLAAAYVDLRHGDSTAERLQRAQTLARMNSGHTESRLMLARAALDARDFALARETMAALIGPGTRPTVRTCLTMADIEETQHGDSGRVREWLARATRAPRDPIWIADGLLSEKWAPASPVTGRLDAFRWEAPTELLTAPEIPVETVETVDDHPEAPALEAEPPPAGPAAAQTITADQTPPDSPKNHSVDQPAEPAGEPEPEPVQPATAALMDSSAPSPGSAPAKPAPRLPIGQPDDPGPR